MVGRFTKGSLSVSMIIGTLLIPLSALAALWLTGPDDGDGAEATATTSSTTTAPALLDTTPELIETGVTRADLETACGPEGRQLVSLEEAGTISGVQQAALDALRDLCEQQGLSLPAKPAGEPIVQTVIVPATPVTTTVAATTTPTFDDHDDYEDDDRYEDDHDEDEDHEEDDHEDGDHEDGDHEDDKDGDHEDDD